MSSQKKENQEQGKKEIPIPTFSYKRVNNSADHIHKKESPNRRTK